PPYSRLLFAFSLFNVTDTTAIYTLSLHDALPICLQNIGARAFVHEKLPALRGLKTAIFANVFGYTPDDYAEVIRIQASQSGQFLDRKSTRLNSSHVAISYAVFCLKKKNMKRRQAY